MDIVYLGQSSFRISDKNASLVTDPFDPNMLGLKFPKVEADIVTVSHNHEDHNKVENVQNVHKVITEPGEYEVRGISILGFSSFHDDKKGEERGKNIIYVIEVDGFRLAHLGDLGHILTEQQVNALGDIDVLFIPVGGTYTIGPKEAALVAKAIEPKIIIPMHYQMDGENVDLHAALKPVSDFVTETGMTAETLNKLSLKEASLSEEKKLIILERK